MLARSLFQINAIAILQNRSSQYARDIQKTVSTPVKSLVKCFSRIPSFGLRGTNPQQEEAKVSVGCGGKK
jgi:hypothetical protein